MPDQLSPCTGCARHIRLSERACPFCATAHVPVDAPPLVDAPSGLSRAAMLLLGASLAFAGCERSANNPTTQPTMVPGTTPVASQPSSADIYGAPPPPIPPAPAYGLPPPPPVPPPTPQATIYGGPPPRPMVPPPGSGTPPGGGTPAP